MIVKQFLVIRVTYYFSIIWKSIAASKKQILEAVGFFDSRYGGDHRLEIRPKHRATKVTSSECDLHYTGSTNPWRS
jgi:hypothetical protein